MIHTPCALCGPQTPSLPLYPETFDLEDLKWSSRKIPDGTHHEIHQCQNCGLIFSNPILDLKKIELLNRESPFLYADEQDHLKLTYGSYLKKTIPYLSAKNSFLEIGCGNGFFLEEALKLGFKEVHGVEPSLDAVKKASPSIQKNIYRGIFKEKLYPPNTFDIICAFQLFEHLPYPNDFLKLCYDYLKEQGILLLIHHNVGSWTAKLLKDKSPIFDIQHIYLFDKITQKKILEKNNFKVIQAFNVKNCYSLRYWIQLLPIPLFLKNSMLHFCKTTGLSRTKIKLSVGNIGVVAQKQ